MKRGTDDRHLGFALRVEDNSSRGAIYLALLQKGLKLLLPNVQPVHFGERFAQRHKSGDQVGELIQKESGG